MTNMRYRFTYYVLQYAGNHYSSPINQNKKCYVNIHFIENGGLQLVELWELERAQNLEEIPKNSLILGQLWGIGTQVA